MKVVPCYLVFKLLHRDCYLPVSLSSPLFDIAFVIAEVCSSCLSLQVLFFFLVSPVWLLRITVKAFFPLDVEYET